VTRRGAERTRLHPLNEWEFSNSGFNGQKRSKMNAIAIGTMAREIWPRVGLVNGAPTNRDTIVRRHSRVQRNVHTGRFHVRNGDVRKLSFATNHLFPYLVPLGAPADRESGKRSLKSRPGNMILTEFRVAKAP
jgi:hypothetical protein